MRINTKLSFLSLWILFILLPMKECFAQPYFQNLPYSIFLKQNQIIDKKQTEVISQKLGGKIKTLSNSFLTVQGRSIQVNIIEAETKADANQIYEAISRVKNNPAFCIQKKSMVFEYITNDPNLALKTSYELGILPKPNSLRYQVTAKIATVTKSDYMALNRLFNFLVKKTQGLTNMEINSVKNLLHDFTFGEDLTLRSLENLDSLCNYSFSPLPKTEPLHNQGAETYHFAHLNKILNIPYVTIIAKINTNSSGFTPSNRSKDASLTAATDFWPSDDLKILNLAEDITKNLNTASEKVTAILKWLQPGRNIQFEGPIVGVTLGCQKSTHPKIWPMLGFCRLFYNACPCSRNPLQTSRRMAFGNNWPHLGRILD